MYAHEKKKYFFSLLRLQLTLFKTFINTTLPTSFNTFYVSLCRLVSFSIFFFYYNIHSETLEEEKSVQNKYLNMAFILNKHAVEHLPKVCEGFTHLYMHSVL